MDGQAAAFIPLTGSRAAGRMFILDAADLLPVARRFGLRWRVQEDRLRNAYVTSARARVARLANQNGHSPQAHLARLLVGAARADVVRFANGDSLDLRRSNLVRMTAEEARQWRRGLAAGRTAAAAPRRPRRT